MHQLIEITPISRTEWKSKLRNPKHDPGWKLKIPALISWCAKHTAKCINMDLCWNKTQQGLTTPPTFLGTLSTLGRTARSNCLGVTIHSDTAVTSSQTSPAGTCWLAQPTVEKGSAKGRNPTSLTGHRSLGSQRRFSSSLQASRPQSRLSHLKWLLRALQLCRYWSSEKQQNVLTYALSAFYIHEDLSIP